jgi:hypothetical protein
MADPKVRLFFMHALRLLRALRRQVGAMPCATSAAMPGLAQRRVRVDGLADVDRVRAHLDGQRDSPIMSPACVPTMPPPMMRWVSASKSSLVKPSSAVGDGAAGGAHGNRPFDLDALGLGLVFGQPTHATSGSV